MHAHRLSSRVLVFPPLSRPPTVDHRILCIEVDADRILGVGTGGEDGIAHRRWVAAEVRRAIGERERFYVISPKTGSEGELEPARWPACRRPG